MITPKLPFPHGNSDTSFDAYLWTNANEWLNFQRNEKNAKKRERPAIYNFWERFHM